MSITLPVRSTDPGTSHGAAAKAVLRRPLVRDAVLAVLSERGPMTHEDLVSAYQHVRNADPSWPPATESSIRTRCKELVRDGLVEPVPDQSGKSSMGNRALLWRAVAV